MIARPLVLASLLLAGAALADRLKVTVTPAELTAGSETGAIVTVTTEDGRVVENATLRATVGEVIGNRWDPGARRSPALVLIAAEARGPDGTPTHGAAMVELIGRGSLPTRTEPGASVVVSLGGRRYGPAIADAQGEARIDVEVRASETEAEIEATSARGRRTLSRIALPPVTYPRGLAFVPTHLEAGEHGVVTVFLPSGAGEPRIVVVTASGPVELGAPAWQPADRDVRRWEAPLRATTGGEVWIEISAAGGLLARQGINVATPARARAPHRLGVHAGGVGDLTGRWSAMLGADWGWGWLRVGADVVFGDDILALSLEAGLRLRVASFGRWAVEAGAGAGAAWVDGDLRSALSPYAYVTAGVLRQAAGGELALELRYSDLRVDRFRVGAAGNLAGLALTVGYRHRF